MRTWNGMVELYSDDRDLGKVHADLCAEAGEWWGELRGAARFGLRARQRLQLTLPDGTEATAVFASTEPSDIYHRVEITGDGTPPF